MNAIIRLNEGGLVMPCPRCGQRNRLPYERLQQPLRCGQCRADLRPPGEPVEIDGTRNFDSLISRCTLPVLVDFWAPWCGPCKMVAPELVKVAAEGPGRWLIAKVNTETLPELAQRFSISGIPALVLFKNGREAARQSGAMPAKMILRFMEQNS